MALTQELQGIALSQQATKSTGQTKEVLTQATYFIIVPSGVSGETSTYNVGMVFFFVCETIWSYIPQPTCPVGCCIWKQL